MECVLARDKAQVSPIVEVAVNGPYVVYNLDSTFCAGRDRTRIVTHKVQLNACTGRVGVFHSFDKIMVNVHCVTSCISMFCLVG